MEKGTLAIVAALDDEIRILQSKVALDARILHHPSVLIQGKWGKTPIVLVRSGIGKKAMRHAASLLLTYAAPRAVLHVGFCGAASPALVAGDLILATSVVDATTRQSTVTPKDVLENFEKMLRDRGVPLHRGTLVAVDQVVADPHEKAFTGTQHGAVAIDMESSAFAEAIAPTGIPYVIARSVLDTLDQRWEDMRSMVDDEGNASLFSAFMHCIRRPKATADLLRLAFCAFKARESITKAAEAWILKENG